LNDRLGELLSENQMLYGVICRDLTLIDAELMAQEGYNIVWIDLEHCPQSTSEALRLCRTISHLGMVPLVRILELTRTHVQRILDGGGQIITLPDTRNAAEVAKLVQLGKYPPVGGRGVSTSSAGTNYSIGSDPKKTLAAANRATHLMMMFESDEAYEKRAEMLAVDAVNMMTIGPMDWAVNAGLFGDEAKAVIGPKIERLLIDAAEAGKITAMGPGSDDQLRRYKDIGVRIFFVGVDVNLKRKALSQAIGSFRQALD